MAEGVFRLLGFAIGLSIAFAACSNDGDDQAGTTHPGAQAGEPGSAGLPSGTGGSAEDGAGVGGTSGNAGAGGHAQAGRAGAGSGGRAQAGRAGAGSGGAAQAAGGAGGETQAPDSSWVNATGNLANMPSECGNLTLVSAVPGAATVIAGVAQAGLWATNDGGAHWNALGTGAGSAVITNRPSSIVYDPDHANTFWESGIYNGGGVYKTTDGGQTFEQLGNVSHNDLVSVDFTDPERKTLLVGGHEQKQTLYLSTDGGQNFDAIGMNLPADSHFSSAPLVLDAQTFLLGACGYGDGTCGVFRSTDGGTHWDLASDQPAVARPLPASDGNIYWPLIYNGGLARGTSDGTSWVKAIDNVVSWYPVELPDGRILSIRGDHVAVSADHGASFTPIGETLPFSATGVTYSVATKTLFVWHWDCGSVVLPDAIASAGFDYTQE
jgi:hypothetical protein